MEEKETRKPIFYALYGAAFLLILLAVLLWHILTPDREYSASEKKNLAGLPAFSLSALTEGRLTQDLDSSAADQFPLRDRFMNIRTRALMLLGQRESNGVYLGSENSLLQRFEETDEKLSEQTAQAVSDFAERYPASKCHFLLVPTAVSMLSERLPAGALNADENAWMDRFLSQLSPQIDAPDVRSILREAKADGISLYYHSDHHWTTDAAMAVYEALREDFSYSDTIWKRAVVSNTFRGSLSAKSGYTLPVYDEVAVYLPEEEADFHMALLDENRRVKGISCYDSEALAGNDPYEVFFGGNYPLLTIETSLDSDRTLLVFKDSYANCFLPFLVRQYSKIDMIDPRYFAEDMDVWMAWEQYSDILFLYNASTLSQDRSLMQLLGE